MTLLLLAGCATVSGTPAPAAPAPETSATTGRPRDVPIDDVDPCTLLTDEQREELGLDAEPRLDVGPLPPYPGDAIPLCLFGGFQPRAVSLAVATVSTTGIELFHSGGLVADVRPIEVRGFPALIAIATRNTDFCTVVVDVAPAQAVDVSFGLDGPGALATVDSLCMDAERAANAVIETLLSTR
jgi:hypothetical protein